MIRRVMAVAFASRGFLHDVSSVLCASEHPTGAVGQVEPIKNGHIRPVYSP